MSAADAYERLERESAKPRDHTAKWELLSPLGSVNGTLAEDVGRFCDRKRISREALFALDPRVKVDRNGGIFLAFAGFNDAGRVTAIKYRPIDGNSADSRAEGPSVWLRPPVVGHSDSLEWFVAEGETDAARLLDLLPAGAAVLVLPAGALTFKPEWVDRIPRGATVYLCHDADKAGDEGADKAARILGSRTIRVRPPEEGTDWCDWLGSREQFIELVRSLRAGEPERPFSLSLDEFIALERPDVEPLIVDPDGRPLIARNSLTLCGGLGGSGKTTFFVELALHLAAGVDYLGFTIPAPSSVLLIENEGPEEMFAEKLEAKRASFPHELKARIGVCTVDWGGFNLRDSQLKQCLRADLAQHAYDLIFGDPLDSLGIEGVGSPEDTRKFLELLKETGVHRSVAWWLNTHPRKEETKEALNEISGAWGGKPDAVLLLSQLADDRSRVRFPKLRWAKRGRRATILLAFDADTEAFSYLGEEGDEERDYLGEVIDLLSDGTPRTVKEITAKKDADEPGIGADETAIKKLLEAHPETFVLATGNEAKALGRSSSAHLYLLSPEVRSGQNAPNAPGAFPGEDEEGAGCAALIGAAADRTQLTTDSELSSASNAPANEDRRRETCRRCRETFRRGSGNRGDLCPACTRAEGYHGGDGL